MDNIEINNRIVECLSIGCEPDLYYEYTDYHIFDKYVDDCLSEGLIIKHSEWDFTGEKWANMINERLSQNKSDYKLVSVKATDEKLNEKVKGQAVYFILSKNQIPIKPLIFTWTHKPFYLSALV